MIPPPAQRTMAGRIGATQSEVTASHSVYVSQPETVATLIAQAAARRRGPVNTTQAPYPTLTVTAAAPARPRSGAAGTGSRNHASFGKNKDLSAERSVVPRPQTWLRP